MREFVVQSDGRRVAGEKLLGSGGQGEVWQTGLDGRPVAVKVYHRHTAAPAQREALERLAAKAPPAHYFLWPLAMVEDPAGPSFGYVMELRAARFRPLHDFLARRVTPSFRSLLNAAWQLADGFLVLHSEGLCYRDISFGNIFFDPDNGDIRICDNDNVDISGSAVGGILGTPRFMAPEIVRGEASPSAQTDLYSLAVLLFYMLMGGHPLDGEREARIRCMDGPALAKLYGFEPLYIFHPADASNRPRPGIHDNPIALPPLYPPAIRELFLRSFTDGLDSPSRRVRESEWRKAVSRARDLILPCSCGAQSFYDPDLLRAGTAQKCWSCARPLPPGARMRIGADIVLLTLGARLYPWHVGLAADGDEAIAEVAAHPGNPAILGLRNLTADTWTLTRPDGTVATIPPGRAATVATGVRINFGTVSGEIRA